MRGPAALSIVVALLTALNLTAQNIRGGGSDLLGETESAALRDALVAEGLDPDLQFAGSMSAWRAVSSGDLDFAIVAYRDSLPLDRELEQFPVAFQVVMFAVHSSNPVNSISYPDLVGLFSETGTLQDWGAVVQDPNWSNRQVMLAAVRSMESMSLEIFNAEVIKGDDLKRGIRYSADPMELANLFVQNQAALILMPAVEAGSNFRFLSIRKEEGQPAYSPSPDNVLFGDYPLRLPFHLVIKRSMDPEVRSALLRAVASKEFLKALAEANFMPIPETEREALLSVAD